MLYFFLVKHRKFTVTEVRALLQRIPFSRLLGVRLVRLHANGITISCKVTDLLRNRSGALHGGVSASLADIAVGVSVYRHLGDRRPIATTDLKINYFLPVTEGRLFARSHLLRVGRRLCVGRVDLSDERKQSVGIAVVTYVILSAAK
jgi:uncharacterized protein (TIGR00369 family)